MKRKTLFLITGILTLVVLISSLFDSDPGTLFGSVWLFRLGWLIMSITAFINYFKIKNNDKSE